MSMSALMYSVKNDSTELDRANSYKPVTLAAPKKEMSKAEIEDFLL